MPEEQTVVPAATTQTQTATEQGTATDQTAAEETTLLGDKGEQTEQDKGSQETKPIVPEKYDFKLPEGVTLDEGLLGDVTPVFKELGISQEGAQKLADAYLKNLSKQSEAQSERTMSAYKEVVEGWKADTKKELGADADKSLSFAAKAINKFGNDKLREMMNETGVGNHPELVKFFIAVGKSVSEDSFVDPNRTSGGESSLYDHPTSQATLVK